MILIISKRNFLEMCGCFQLNAQRITSIALTNAPPLIVNYINWLAISSRLIKSSVQPRE